MSAINNPKLARNPLAVIAGVAARAEAIAAAASVPTWMVFLAATGLGSWALWLYLDKDLTLMFNDAVAHLNISRQVIDSATPSFSQLGGVWLPLPHVLMLPTIWNDTMWHTGLSGSIVSLLAFGLSAAYMHRLIQALTENGLAALLGTALFATNANLLFMQATPMTEALTIFLIVGATFHLLRWTQGGSLLQFALSAMFVMAATMTRYETWILAPAGMAVVAVTAFHRHRTFSHVEGFTVAWGVLACYGILLWLLYNQVIFGDIRHFSSDPGAATAFAKVAEADGLLPTKHDLPTSASVYGWSVIDNLGLPVVLAGVLGLVFLIFSRAELPVKLAILLPLSIAAFHVASLTAGQSVVWSPHSFPHLFYNSRYGLMMLPAAVVAASYLARPFRSAGILLLVAVLSLQLIAIPSLARGAIEVQSAARADDQRAFARNWIGANYPLFKAGQQISLAEVSTPDFDRSEAAVAAEWLGKNAREGRILISQQASAALMFDSKLSLSSFISEGNKPYFGEELQSPGRHTRWIVYQPGNPFDVLHALLKNGAPEGYQRAFEGGGFEVFERSDQTSFAPGRQTDGFLNGMGGDSP